MRELLEKLAKLFKDIAIVTSPILAILGVIGTVMYLALWPRFENWFSQQTYASLANHENLKSDIGAIKDDERTELQEAAWAGLNFVEGINAAANEIDTIQSLLEGNITETVDAFYILNLYRKSSTAETLGDPATELSGKFFYRLGQTLEMKVNRPVLSGILEKESDLGRGLVINIAGRKFPIPRTGLKADDLHCLLAQHLTTDTEGIFNLQVQQANPNEGEMPAYVSPMGDFGMEIVLTARKSVKSKEQIDDECNA